MRCHDRPDVAETAAAGICAGSCPRLRVAQPASRASLLQPTLSAPLRYNFAMAQVKEQHEDIISYTFLGEENFVESGKEALIMVCDTMRRENEGTFKRLPAEICYRDKRWFSR